MHLKYETERFFLEKPLTLTSLRQNNLTTPHFFPFPFDFISYQTVTDHQDIDQEEANADQEYVFHVPVHHPCL